MEEDIVLLDVTDGVAHVTLNRPVVHNAFDEAMIAELTDVFERMDKHDDVQAIVLRGLGKSFSAGADLNWMKRAAEYTEEQNKADALKLAQMLYKLYSCSKVTIAVVQGAAMGGGMGLVSCCDIVLTDKDTKFALSEVKLGLIPATIAPYVLRAIGERQASRFFQTGERFDGQKAYDIGLAHELAERPEDVDYLLHHILKNISANGPHAMKAAKKLCRDMSGQPLSHDLLKETAERIAKIRAGDEAKEGLGAFLEKRNPNWIKG